MNLKRFAALLVALMMTLSVFAACGQVPDDHVDTPVVTSGSTADVGDVTTTPSPETLPPETDPAPVTSSEPVTTSAPATEPAPATTPAPTTAKEDPNGFTVEAMSATMYATISLNVRSGPSADYDRIGTLDEGEAVTVTGRASTGWYQVSIDGKTGYVSNIYLSATAPSGTATKPVGGNNEPAPGSSDQEVVDDEPFEETSGTQIGTADWVSTNGVEYMYNLFTDSKYQNALNKIAMAVEIMAPSVSLAEYLTPDETIQIASNIVQMVGTGYCYFKGVKSVSGGTTMNLQYFVDNLDDAQKMVNELESSANKIVKKISGYSDYNKVKYIYEWLCTNNSYGGTYESSAYGSVVAGGANCLGYAKGAFYLLSKAGFDVVYVTGYGTDPTAAGRHSWVKVKLDGKWYNVDAGWGDPSTNQDPNYVCYDFLLVTDDYIKNTRISVDDLSMYYKMPSATSDDYNWYKLNGYYATSMSEVESVLKKATSDCVKNGGNFVYARIMVSSVDLINEVIDTYSQSYYTKNILNGITSNYKINNRIRDDNSGIKKTRTITFKLEKK